MNSKEIIKYLKNSIDEKGNYCYSLPVETTRKTIKCIKEKDNEIERLNNIINKGIEAINVYQDKKTLSVGYQDLKRIRGILQGNEFDLQMFEEYLKELGEKNENE